MESGKGDQYKGKTLAEINIDPTIETAEEEEEDIHNEFLDVPVASSSRAEDKSESLDSDNDYESSYFSETKETFISRFYT